MCIVCSHSIHHHLHDGNPGIMAANKRSCKLLAMLLCACTSILMSASLSHWKLLADNAPRQSLWHDRPQNIDTNSNSNSNITSTRVHSETPLKDGTTNRNDNTITELASTTRSTSTTVPLKRNITVEDAKEMSSVDYHTCCGLGHRMSKMMNANHVAKLKGFSLRVNWGWCDGKIPVFPHFFGPQPLEELVNVTSRGHFLRINNEPNGFKKLIRKKNEECKCTRNVMVENAEYFESLRRRFRHKDAVESFCQANFANYTVIGIHVRAGNGETGDFARKKRAIANQTEWAENVKVRMLEISRGWQQKPLLFIATDTPSIMTLLQDLLSEHMPVIQYEQRRLKEGGGIEFGDFKKVSGPAAEGAPTECIQQMEDSLMDMMILSHADVVISGRPSSFTQSLPMHIALTRPKSERKIPNTYCEFNLPSTEHHCYGDIMNWCCNEDTAFHILETVQRYEYLRLPYSMESYNSIVQPRPEPPGRTTEQDCKRNKNCAIPYDFS